MGDLNLLNIFFDADNISLKSDVKDFPFPSKENCEPEEPAEWFNDDTLNQMLPLLDKFFSNCDENIDNFAANEHSFNDKFFQKQSSVFPEKSVLDKELTIDAKLKDDVPTVCKMQVENISSNEANFSTSDETFFDAIEYVQEEVIEFEEISVSSSPQSDVSVLSDDDSDADECNYFMSDHVSQKMKIVFPKHTSKYPERMIRLPSKKIKPTDKLGNKNERRKEKNSTDSLHPRLQLTPEETRVALKEGIELPSHYPLTREQQRQLKRIRRKIRNKISAQHSRRRKQEYVDSLEQKLKHNAAEKVSLMNRIKSLEREKSTLATKVGKLQAALARCSGQMAQPTSCLLVLIMSMALILAPSLKNSSLLDESVGERDMSMFDGQSSSLLTSGRSSSRNLLFSQNSSENQNDAKDEFKMIADLLEKIRLPNSNVLSKYLDLLRMKTSEKDSSERNINYLKTEKHENFEIDDNLQAPSKTYKLLPSELEDSKNETVDFQVQKPITINWLGGEQKNEFAMHSALYGGISLGGNTASFRQCYQGNECKFVCGLAHSILWSEELDFDKSGT